MASGGRSAVGLVLVPLMFIACGGSEFQTNGSGGDGGGGSAGSGGAGGRGGSGGAGDTCEEDCSTLSTTCSVGFCEDGVCVSGPANEGGFCTDGDECTDPDRCLDGVCTSGPAVDCSFLDTECSRGLCSPVRGCIGMPYRDGESCEDGSICTLDDTCTASMCTGVPIICPQPSEPCLTAACDEITGGCSIVPSGDGAGCDDGNACTAEDRCSAGTCIGGPPSCLGGDGCCPPGCSAFDDLDCGCTNIATDAVASFSAGGTNEFGPQSLNDGVGEPACSYAWIATSSTSTGVWMELRWPTLVTVAALYVQTENAVTPSSCNTQPGRNLASGTVQYLDAQNQWVPATTFTGRSDDVSVDLGAPVTTTALRIMDMRSGPGNGNTIVYEWYVYSQSGCGPLG